MKRVAALDGVRGIAIAAVVGLHAFAWPVNGVRGVDIFFVLSGFLITTLLMNEWDANGSVRFRAFYARRARRLLPALALTIVGYMAVAVITDHHIRQAAVASLVAGTYTTNLIGFTSHPNLGGPLSHTWSLAAEEQFYLVWPVVLFLVFRGRRRPAICLLLAAIAAVAVEQRVLPGMTTNMTQWRLTGAPDTRSTGLAMGCLCALCVPELSRLPASARSAGRLVVPLALAMVALGLFAGGFDFYRMGGLTFFCVAVAALLVNATTETSLTARVLSLAPLVWLGRISYSLYLYHFPILIAFGAPANRSLSRRVLAIELSVLAAFLSFRYVEQPILRRGRSRVPSPAPPVPGGVDPAPAVPAERLRARHAGAS
jgi:peptidoglycan/LPS O-acetylase OafA/YrhL